MKKLNKKPFSVISRIRSFTYAFSGIYKAIITQHNLWIHLVMIVFVIVLGVFTDISTTEWLVVILCFGFVLSAEIFNSAVEVLTDLISPEYNPKAGLVKDMAAGAVLVTAIVSAIVGLIIFIPKLYNLL